jgi:multidrug efflux pump subunit AcrB
MLLERGLDVFSVLLVEAVVFVFAAMAMRLRLWSAVLVSLLYVPLVFIFIFWIGYRAGFYDLP